MSRKADVRGEKRQFLLGMTFFFAVFLLSFIWIMFIMPIAYTWASQYAAIVFGAGILGAVVLIFMKRSLMALGGGLATIIYITLFAVTWPLFR